MKSIWFNIIFLLCAGELYPQAVADLRFLHLTDKDGLSNNEVNCITQSEDGIIWVGTSSGLNRFDGYGFKNFYADANDPKAIPNNIISSIVPDKKNNLWISTNEGLFYFDAKTQQAHAFKSIAGDTNSFKTQIRPFIYLDSTQLPWIITFDGLYHFVDSLHYKRVNEGLDSISKAIKKLSNNYGAIYSDRFGQLWSSWGNLLLKMDNKTKKVVKIYKCTDPIIIRQILFDSKNRCWISTFGNGLYLFNPENLTWQAMGERKKGLVVYGGAEWMFNNRLVLVFTCSDPGLFFIDESDLSTYVYPFDGNTIAIKARPFVDRQNILWVPTATDGIYYCTPSGNLFSIMPVPALKDEEGQSRLSDVYNMRETPSGFWISKRYNGGILWYDRNWKLIKSWPKIPIQFDPRYTGEKLTDREGYDFRQEGDNMFVTTESGISILNLKSLQWSTYAPPGLKSGPRLRNIVVQNDHAWWLRSFDQGVFVYDPSTKQFLKHYGNDPVCNNCLSKYINYLVRTRNGNIFAATDNGLYEYNNEKDIFSHVSISEDKAMRNSMFCLAEDDDGLIWIGAENGIFAFNPGTRQVVKTFSENNKIGTVFRICIDDDQNIWFDCVSGYWCWLRNPDKVIHFEYNMGLPKTGEGVFYKASDGTVYAGAKDALVHFFPDRLMDYHSIANTKIIEAVTNDTLAPFDNKASGQKSLTLSPKESSVNINFDVINYDLLSANQFFYKLDPGNNGWEQSPTGHLSFNNLQPGTYRLEVKGSNKLTGRFTNSDSLDIIVRPWWYQSNWFKLACILLSAAIIFLIVRYQIHNVHKEAAFKQKIAETEMTALRNQMNPHFIFNSLNSIENFIMQNEKRLASDYLNKFARLIRIILENSRIRAVPLSQDMEAMQLYIDLEQLRFNNKFSYFTEIDKTLLDGDYKVAPLLIQPFVENAILHGLAPSDRKDLYLRISVKLVNDYIHYNIEDNGIGRERSLVNKERNKKGYKSLGLQITKERIDIINQQQRTEGMLKVEDLYEEANKVAGTRVILTIKTT